MKAKYVVFHDEDHPIKTFKNEPEAVSFYGNPKSSRQYGSLFLERHDADGSIYTYNDHTRGWDKSECAVDV